MTGGLGTHIEIHSVRNPFEVDIVYYHASARERRGEDLSQEEIPKGHNLD